MAGDSVAESPKLSNCEWKNQLSQFYSLSGGLLFQFDWGQLKFHIKREMLKKDIILYHCKKNPYNFSSKTFAPIFGSGMSIGGQRKGHERRDYGYWKEISYECFLCSGTILRELVTGRSIAQLKTFNRRTVVFWTSDYSDQCTFGLLVNLRTREPSDYSESSDQ